MSTEDREFAKRVKKKRSRTEEAESREESERQRTSDLEFLCDAPLNFWSERQQQGWLV